MELLAHWHIDTLLLWNSNQFYYQVLKLKDRLLLLVRAAQKLKSK